MEPAQPDDTYGMDDRPEMAATDLEIVRSHANSTASIMLHEAASSHGTEASLGGPPPEVLAAHVDSSTAELGTPFAAIIAGLWAWTEQWKCHRLPQFHAVRHIHPEPPPQPQLGIQGPEWSVAPIGFSGLMHNPSPNQWLWSRNWTTVSKLPAAPRSSRLFYQFNATADLNGESQASGLDIWTSVYFGIVPDSSVNSPYLAAGYNTPKAYPARLHNAPLLSNSGSSLIAGSLAVRAGSVPAVAVTLQVDVLMTTGWATLAPYLNRMSVAPASPSRSAMNGCIEYRYEPQSLLGSIATLHR